MPRLGTLRPTPRFRNARGPWQRGLETPQMVRGHTLRPADGKQRLPPCQTKNHKRDQRKRPSTTIRQADRRGLRKTSGQYGRSRPRKSRLPETAGKRRDKPAAKNNCCEDLRTCPRENWKGRRRNRPPNKEQTGLISNGQVYRAIPTPDQNPPWSQITNQRCWFYREADLDSDHTRCLSNNGRDPDLRNHTYREHQRPVRTATSYLRVQPWNTSRARNRANRHSRTNPPSALRLQDDQCGLHKPSGQSLVHRREQSAVGVHDRLRGNRLLDRRSIQRHKQRGTTYHAQSTVSIPNPRPASSRRSRDHPPRRDAAEKMGLWQRNQPVHSRRSLPLHSMEHARANLTRSRWEIFRRDLRLCPVDWAGTLEPWKLLRLAERPLPRRKRPPRHGRTLHDPRRVHTHNLPQRATGRSSSIIREIPGLQRTFPNQVLLCIQHTRHLRCSPFRKHLFHRTTPLPKIQSHLFQHRPKLLAQPLPWLFHTYQLDQRPTRSKQGTRLLHVRP